MSKAINLEMIGTAKMVLSALNYSYTGDLVRHGGNLYIAIQDNTTTTQMHGRILGRSN